MKSQNFLIQCYAFARSKGYLDNKFFKWIFIRTYFLYKKFFEDDLAKLSDINPKLFKNGHIIDIGANIGYTSCVLARMKDKNKNLYSFEPEKWNFSILSSLTSALHNVEIFQEAVGESERKVQLLVNDAHHADHRVTSEKNTNGVMVDMVSVDSFLKKKNITTEPIAFVKIDVQGYEMKVCEGMRQTLDQNPFVSVFIEVMAPDKTQPDTLTSAKDIFSFFSEKNFKAYVFQKKTFTQVKKEDISFENFKKGYADVLFTKQDLVF